MAEFEDLTANPSGSGKSLKNQSVSRSAAAMAAGTFSSRLLGFVRDALILALLPRPVTDAFVVAFRLPNVARRILSEGALASSFIPAFASLEASDPARARRLSSAAVSVVLALSSLLALLAFVFMPWILREGLSLSSNELPLTLPLARVMIFYLILVANFAFLSSIANLRGHFFIPALAPALFNLVIVIATCVAGARGEGFVQAWAVLAGGFLQLALVLGLLWKNGERLSWAAPWKNEDLKSVVAAFLPGLAGVGVFQAMALINTRFAAGLPSGSQSYLYVADRLLELPQSLISVSLASALLPRLSSLHASGARGGLLQEASRALHALLFLSLPAAVGLGILAEPIARVLFAHGGFSVADAQVTGQVVQIYAAVLVMFGLARVLSPAFYAVGRASLPALIVLLVLISHVIMNLMWAPRLGLNGIAWATLGAACVNAGLLLAAFLARFGGLEWRRLARELFILTPGLLLLAAWCRWGWIWFSEIWFSQAGALGAVILGGVIVYLSGARLTHFWVSKFGH